MDSDQNRQAAAQELFDDPALKEKVEQSTLAWGGNELKEVDPLTEEQAAAAKELLDRIVIVSVEQYKKDPESLTEVEVTARRLQKKMEMEPPQPLTPGEQAQLYMAFNNMEKGMDDGDLAKRMKFVESDGHTVSKEGLAYLEEMKKAQQEIFFNLTGIDPEDSFDFDAGKGKVQGLFAELKYLIPSKGKKWEEKDYADARARHRDALFSGRVGEFKPEEAIVEAVAAAVDPAKKEIAQRLKMQVGRNWDSPNWLPSVAKVAFGRYLSDIESATTPDELERAVNVMEGFMRWHGASGAKAFCENQFDKNKPESKAELVVLENMAAEENDKLAQAAFRRELPTSQSDLEDAVDEYKKEIKEKSKSKKKEDRDRVILLNRRLAVAEDALRLVKDKNALGKLRTLEGNVSVQDLEKEFLPGMPSELSEEFDTRLAKEYGVDISSAKGKADRRTLIEKGMKAKKKTAPKLGGFIMRWMYNMS